MTSIAIIVGSTRPNRKARKVADWVLDRARSRDDATFEVVDLADHDLPHLDEPAPAAMGPDYTHDHTRVWAERIAGFDGFVFVVPEYNHSMPGVLKNALDFLYVEWHDKAAGCVSYGIDGGTRAVEHLRLVLGELHVAPVQAQVALSPFDDFDDEGAPTPRDHQLDRLDVMLTQVISWADALAPVRERAAVADTEAEGGRPSFGASGDAAGDADTAVEGFVAELQTGIDAGDADVYNRHFAADVLWGNPYGGTLQGYDELHAIHTGLLAEGTGGPASRYEVDRVLRPTPDVAVAHVRRVSLGADGQPVTPTDDSSGAFSEMALHVVVRRRGAWWLAAGHNTPIRPHPGASTAAP